MIIITPSSLSSSAAAAAAATTTTTTVRVAVVRHVNLTFLCFSVLITITSNYKIITKEYRTLI